ncbi:MAG: hypothetical protein DLM55_10515 [Acidimicrobiales bacterium]|nr:MAG: hypothetical protein DLM55_10515 [Acidimicrobiales bacterium]
MLATVQASQGTKGQRSLIYIAGDRFAEPALVAIRTYLAERNKQYVEFGYLAGRNPGVSLQEFIPQVTEVVRKTDGDTGILVCGTGAGVEIGANRFPGIRASLCGSAKNAEWARVYDAANVLCIASWMLDDIDLSAILDAWYGSEYDGDINRRKMLHTFDEWAQSD